MLFVGSLLPNAERERLVLLKIACNGQLLAFTCYLQERFNEKGVYSWVILEIGGTVRQVYKRALFPYKNLEENMSDSSNTHVHSIFKLLLIKQTFEKNKSLRAPSKSRTQFWPTITYYT